MTSNISELLKKLGIKQEGRYENNFYVIDLADSNDYAKMYTVLDKHAVNTEYPGFGVNSNKTTTRITTYFEYDFENETYNIFLIADFDKDEYFVKIGER